MKRYIGWLKVIGLLMLYSEHNLFITATHSVLQRGIDTINVLELQPQRRDDLSSLVMNKMFRPYANTV